MQEKGKLEQAAIIEEKDRMRNLLNTFNYNESNRSIKSNVEL